MVPREARHLRTFAELQSYLRDFADGRYPFLWVFGRPGTAKTESIRAAVRGRRVYLRKGGQLTPLRFYIDCYRHRGEPIILDDAEHVLDSMVGAKLVSDLGDTTPEKLMSFGTTARALDDVPETFYTNSSLCVIAKQAHGARRHPEPCRHSVLRSDKPGNPPFGRRVVLGSRNPRLVWWTLVPYGTVGGALVCEGRRRQARGAGLAAARADRLRLGQAVQHRPGPGDEPGSPDARGQG
jgi:hypothetical protein